MVVTEPAELTATITAADAAPSVTTQQDRTGVTGGSAAGVNPHAVVTAITDFGLSGPWADRPATDLTLQAMSGGPGQRVSYAASMAGGRLGEWTAGMFAAAHTAAALYGGGAELLDISVLESLILTTTAHPVSCYTIAGTPMRPIRARNLPDIHPTKDGYIGFMVVTGQQWLDFCSIVDRSDWMEDAELGVMTHRFRRRNELGDGDRRLDHRAYVCGDPRNCRPPAGARRGGGHRGDDPAVADLAVCGAHERNETGGFCATRSALADARGRPTKAWIGPKPRQWHAADLAKEGPSAQARQAV